MIRAVLGSVALVAMALGGCDSAPPAPTKPIEVRGAEQDKLHQLDALNLAIALKRAIYDLGYTCQRVETAGFVTRWENLDMWSARCNDGRQWAIFTAADGTAQVRDCKDLAASGLPACEIKKVPPGSFEPATR